MSEAFSIGLQRPEGDFVACASLRVPQVEGIDQDPEGSVTVEGGGSHGEGLSWGGASRGQSGGTDPWGTGARAKGQGPHAGAGWARGAHQGAGLGRGQGWRPRGVRGWRGRAREVPVSSQAGEGQGELGAGRISQAL